jgi:hypothetical protein
MVRRRGEERGVAGEGVRRLDAGGATGMRIESRMPRAQSGWGSVANGPTRSLTQDRSLVARHDFIAGVGSDESAGEVGG